MPSLYIHIPFCEKKCLYCDFYSIENQSPMEDFLSALHGEIDLYGSFGEGSTFQTVFFGGGTPSLLTPRQLESILSHLRAVFRIDYEAEVTVETNPGTVTREKLQAYRSLGVNRLSIGIQSFHDDELRFLSRIHNAHQSVQCVDFARQAGFGNIGIDLIFSLPGQSPALWQDNLTRSIALQPEHISAYSLIVEDNTPLARLVASKQVSPNPLDEEAALYELTMDVLIERGYEHYEVSNYAMPGFRSRHNYNYWNHENYLGFGPSAHSFWKQEGTLSGRRWWNSASVSAYCRKLFDRKPPLGSQEFVKAKELMNERVFLGLRSDGLDLSELEKKYHVPWSDSQREVIQHLINEKYAALEDHRLRLTSKGYLVCDEISERLLP